MDATRCHAGTDDRVTCLLLAHLHAPLSPLRCTGHQPRESIRSVGLMGRSIIRTSTCRGSKRTHAVCSTWRESVCKCKRSICLQAYALA